MRRFTVLRFWLLIIALAFATPSLATTSVDKIEMLVPMGTLTLKPPTSVEPKRASVQFPHSKHFAEVSCHTCHHDWNTSGSVKGCMTSGCHDSTVSQYETLSEDGTVIDIVTTEARYYKKAYHSQCLGCHKLLKEKSDKIERSILNFNAKIQPAGPIGCIECHPK